MKGSKFNDPIYFLSSTRLLKAFEEVLKKLGPKKLMEGSGEEAKETRESFAAYFLMLAFKKHTGKDFWFSRPREKFPDFELMSIQGGPQPLTLDYFELVTVPERCMSDREMIEIVLEKFRKGYAPLSRVNLVIFLNSKHSQEWLSILRNKIPEKSIFNYVWTIRLLTKDEELWGAEVNSLRPEFNSILVNISDQSLYQMNELPSFVEEIAIGKQKAVVFKQEFINEYRKLALRLRLGK